MTETAHTAEMAERLASELFAEFFWERVGPTNHDWPCEDAKRHGHATHPTDVVYYYDEPYAPVRTYINTDLKSYQKGSITTTAVRGAVESLAKQVACAEKSQAWHELHVHEGVTPSICGLLFVYNHDGEYDKDFRTTLASIKAEALDLPKGCKLVVLGPREIYWLDNIRYELRQMRGITGPGRLPDPEYCRYYYPQLIRRANMRLNKARAATLEMLTSPWIILEYKGPKATDRRGVVVFYARHGQVESEFVYLIDVLRKYEMLDEQTSVVIKTLRASPVSSPIFQKAQQRYIEGLSDAGGSTDLAACVKAIRYEPFTQVRTTYSTIDLGMAA